MSLRKTVWVAVALLALPTAQSDAVAGSTKGDTMGNFRFSRNQQVSSSVARRTRKRLKRLGGTTVGGVKTSDGITGGEARAIRNALAAKRSSADRKVADAPPAGGQKPYRKVSDATNAGSKRYRRVRNVTNPVRGKTP